VSGTGHNARSSAGAHAFPLDLAAISFLVVDDQPFTRRIVRSILHGFGSREVQESANGAEALELTRTMMPNIVVTDLIMPDFDGMKFIKVVKAPTASTRTTSIIVLSGYLTKSTAIELKRAGAEELLAKPVSPKSLYEHISRVVLRSDQATAPMAFVQNQRRHAELQRRRAGEADGVVAVV
jgi:two-component system, chemotaxis family, chemotaxis protein CheY